MLRRSACGMKRKVFGGDCAAAGRAAAAMAKSAAAAVLCSTRAKNITATPVQAFAGGNLTRSGPGVAVQKTGQAGWLPVRLGGAVGPTADAPHFGHHPARGTPPAPSLRCQG